ncbi:MAG: hypothetical protein JSV52_11120, partial [Candidatus Zixiibacteriota bacterium]
MKRKILFAAAGMAVILVAIVAYCLATFDLFDDCILTEIATMDVPDKDYQVGLWYSAGNATAESSVQVWRFDGDVPTVLGVFQRYDSVVSYDLTDDSLLTVVLLDVDALSKKPDTFVVTVGRVADE